MIAASGWLAPLFLLHYAHAVPMWPGLLWLWLAAALALGIANWRVIPVPVSGRRMLYARIGDAWAWLCVAGLAGVAVWVTLLAP